MSALFRLWYMLRILLIVIEDSMYQQNNGAGQKLSSSYHL